MKEQGGGVVCQFEIQSRAVFPARRETGATRPGSVEGFQTDPLPPVEKVNRWRPG